MERSRAGRSARKGEVGAAKEGDGGTAGPQRRERARRGDGKGRSPPPPKTKKSQQEAGKGAAAPNSRKTSQEEAAPDPTKSRRAFEDLTPGLGQAAGKFSVAEMGARPKSRPTHAEPGASGFPDQTQALGKCPNFAEGTKGAAAPTGKQGRKAKGAQKAREAEEAARALVKEEPTPQGSAVVAPKKRVPSRKAKPVPEEEEEGGPPGKESPSAGRRAPPRRKSGQKEREPVEKEAGASEKPLAGDKLVPKEPGQRGNRSLRQVLEKLRLPRVEHARAAQEVNRVRNILVKAIVAEGFPVEALGTGSYYERVKISSPNEFDIMLKVPDLRVEVEPCDGDTSGAFCYVKLKRNPGKKAYLNNDKFLDDKMYLSSSAVLSAFRNIIVKEVKENDELAEVHIEGKKPGSPAVTFLIGQTLSVDMTIALEYKCRNWCERTKNGLDIAGWLGRKVKNAFLNEPLYLVPKNAKDGNCLIGNTWRLSFSHVEKAMITNHGNSKTCCEQNGQKCCRMDCLKLVKYLLEQLKTKHENRNQFEKFHSYLAKTTFFHACTKWTRDDEWHMANLNECFIRLVDYFLDCLRKAELKHFFIPHCNLLQRIPKTKCSTLAKVIENERNNGFPIFFL